MAGAFPRARRWEAVGADWEPLGQARLRLRVAASRAEMVGVAAARLRGEPGLQASRRAGLLERRMVLADHRSPVLHANLWREEPKAAARAWARDVQFRISPAPARIGAGLEGFAMARRSAAWALRGDLRREAAHRAPAFPRRRQHRFERREEPRVVLCRALVVPRPVQFELPGRRLSRPERRRGPLGPRPIQLEWSRPAIIVEDVSWNPVARGGSRSCDTACLNLLASFKFR
jgi:hypothetical protein